MRLFNVDDQRNVSHMNKHLERKVPTLQYVGTNILVKTISKGPSKKNTDSGTNILLHID